MKRDEWAEAMEHEAASVNVMDADWAAQTQRQAHWRKQREMLLLFVTLAALQQGLTHPDLVSILATAFGLGLSMGLKGSPPRLVVLGTAAYVLTTWLVFLLFQGLQLTSPLPELGVWPALTFLGLVFIGNGLGRLTRSAVKWVKESWF